MWELLDLPDQGTRLVLGGAALALVALGVFAVRAWRQSLAPGPSVLVLGALPLSFALSLAALRVRAIHRGEGGVLFDVDVSSLAPIGARLLAEVYARCWLGLGLSGALWVLLASMLVALRVRSRAAPHADGWKLPWVALNFGAAALSASYYAFVHARAFNELPQHAQDEYALLLTAAAGAWDEAGMARAAAAVVALLAALPYALRRVAGERSALTDVLTLVVLGAALHADLALTGWAHARVVDVLAQPWSTDADFQPVLEAELGEERYTSSPNGAVTVVLGVTGAHAFPSGAALPAQHGPLVEALRALRERLAAERAQRTAAYEAEFALEERPRRRASRGDDAREAAGPAMGIVGVLYAPPPWPGCEPAAVEDPLSVALDRRVSERALRAFLQAAVEAGFATIEFVGPVVPPSTLAPLRDDAVMRALVSAPTYAARLTGVARCEAADVPFLRGTVGVALPELEHAAGFTLPLGDDDTVEAYRALERPVPTVVLALGAQVTPLSLLQALSAVQAQLAPLAVRVVPTPEQLPSVSPRVAVPPAPSAPTDEATRVQALVRHAPGVEERDVNGWLRRDLHDAFVGCVRAGRTAAPDAAGNVEVRLLLGADGRASIVFASPDETATPGMAPVAACVADALRATSFQGAPPERATVVRATLVFPPAAAQ